MHIKLVIQFRDWAKFQWRYTSICEILYYTSMKLWENFHLSRVSHMRMNTCIMCILTWSSDFCIQGGNKQAIRNSPLVTFFPLYPCVCYSDIYTHTFLKISLFKAHISLQKYFRANYIEYFFQNLKDNLD